jgi:hypothetical protein
MRFQQNPRPPHPGRRFIAGSITLLSSLAIGCASPGNPRPPTLNLAEVVSDLTARRIGNQVQLHWTTPSRTTDGVAIKGPLTAEFCRQTNPSPAAPCTPVQRIPVTPGPTQAIDPLPPTLTIEPASLLAYRVQIFNSAVRTAGPSPQAFAAAGAAPSPVFQLRATATREGVMLEWQPQPASSQTPSRVELDRTLTGPSVPAPKAAKATAGPSQSLKFTSPPPAEVHLQTGGSTADAGGTLDRTARKGETYTYAAQRVRSVELNGHTLELRSLESSPVTLVLNDTFPPKTPTGLVSVPGDAGSASIDLSWEPNSETDLAGYIVYRQELTSSGQPQGSATHLNPTPVIGPAYHDTTPAPGHHYAYRVTAVDTAGNESRPSTPVQETPREQ